MNKRSFKGTYEAFKKHTKQDPEIKDGLDIIKKIFIILLAAAVFGVIYKVISVGSKIIFAQILNIKVIDKLASDVIIDTKGLSICLKIVWYFIPVMSFSIMFALIFSISKIIYYKFNNKKLSFLKLLSTVKNGLINDNRSIEKDSENTTEIIYNNRVKPYDSLIVILVIIFLVALVLSLLVGLANLLNDINNTRKFDLLLIIIPIFTTVPLLVTIRKK